MVINITISKSPSSTLNISKIPPYKIHPSSNFSYLHPTKFPEFSFALFSFYIFVLSSISNDVEMYMINLSIRTTKTKLGTQESLIDILIAAHLLGVEETRNIID